MSFDTTFNYTGFTNALSVGNARDRASIATVQAEINILTSASSYSSAAPVITRLSQLNAEVTRLNAYFTQL